MKKSFVLLFLLPLMAGAQLADHTYTPNIHAVKLFRNGDMYGYPIIMLNSGDQLELDFDDLDADYKNYYYTYQLCNADWTPCDLQPYDYISGFQTTHISTYQYSSIALTRYTHYQLFLPERNSAPTKSGNYLLKVFLNDDTSNLAFTKRMLVVDNKATVSAQVTQPSDMQLYSTHQRLQVGVSAGNAQINAFSPQDLKVVILQNNIWANSILLDRPTIFRGNYYEYSDENVMTFPAGKEWRWLDLRSLRLQSDRVMHLSESAKGTDAILKPDLERQKQVYSYYHDLDGIYTVENLDGNNPYWQSDYANVHFTFAPPGNQPYAGRDLYLFGELTNYATDDSSKMIFNEEKGVYERTLLLKQGFYNYFYAMKDNNRNQQGPALFYFNTTEGNYWGTENGYMVLVYFRSFGARYDQLVGYARVSSPFQR